MKDVAGLTDAEGLAALGICESLLLALLNSKSSANETCVIVLTDVATTHSEASLLARRPELHRAVVAIVQRILAGKNSAPN